MADAAAMGFELPVGSSYIKEGDNAISKNAQLTADLIERNRNKRGTIAKNVDVREWLYGSTKDGQWDCLSIADCATLTGIPAELAADPRAFSATVNTIGNGVVIKIYLYSVSQVAEYTCTSAPSTGDGWTSWKKTIYWEDLPEDDATVSPSASGFKTLPLALTAGSGGTATAPTSGSVEYDVNLSPDIHVSRYRFAIRDGNPLWGTSTHQVISLSGITFGGVTKLSGMSTKADGSITFSPWFTGNLGNLAFSYNAPQAPLYNVGGGKLGGTRRTTMPFELWLEIETPATTPAIGLVGDSNSVAVNATIPLNDSWLAQYCRDKGFLPVIYGQSGDTMENSGNPNAYKWNRWKHLDRPDVVVHANGANDLPTTEGGITLTQLQAWARAEWEVAAEKISRNQHVALLKSRASGTNNAVRLQWNAWLKTFPDPIREWHDIAAPVTSGDTGGTLPQYLSDDGVHMNTAGHTAIKNALTKVMTTRPSPVVRQAVGRTVSVWDYLNQREQLVYGDTGLRDITALLTGLTLVTSIEQATIRRTGSLVTLCIYGLVMSNSGVALAWGTLPAGMRPQRGASFPLASGASGVPVVDINYGGGFTVSRVTAGQAINGTAIFNTEQPWPTTLPGTAVGSIPS